MNAVSRLEGMTPAEVFALDRDCGGLWRGEVEPVSVPRVQVSADTSVRVRAALVRVRARRCT